jgi:DNA-binding NarL/FixJ family response regulator
VKLVIVEDSQMVLTQLLLILGERPAIRVVGTAAGEDAAVALVAQTQPDVVLLSLDLYQGNGLNALCRIRKACDAARILAFTNHDRGPLRLACETLGISGFYDKSTDIRTCIDQLFSWIPQRSTCES